MTGASATTASEPRERPLDRELLRRILAFTWPHRLRLAGAIALLPVAIACELAQPYLLKIAIDHHIAPGVAAGLGALGAAYLALLAGQYAAGYAQQVLTQAVGLRAMNDLRARLYEKLLALRLSYFDRTPTGRLMTRLTSDIEALAEMFAAGLLSLLGDLLKLALIVITMFVLDAKLATAALLAVPPLVGAVALFRPFMRRAFAEVRAKMAQLNAFLQEHIVGMKIVQAFAQERRVAAAFDRVNREHRDANARAIAADASLYAVVEAMGSFAIAALLWHGGARIHDGALTFGVLVAFIEYAGKFFAPIRDLSTKYSVMQQAMAAAERVFGLLDTDDPDAPVDAGAAVAAATSRSDGIEFSQVSFSYQPGTRILRDVDLRIAAGETVAVVGPSGGGKSSLVKLLLRLYEPDAGRIALGERDIRSMPAAELRRRVALVGQDPLLFEATLRENVALDDPRVDDRRVEAALRRVGAGALLDTRGGLALPIAARGANLSYGERQLVCFARALARDPEVLVLDEATAGVDPETERLVDRGVAEVMAGRTTIVIAHRLSTAARAGRIVVVADGAVAESGTHAELLARDGLYARMHRTFLAAAA